MNEPPIGVEKIPLTDQWVVAGDTHLGAWAIQKGNIVTDPHVFEFLKPFIETMLEKTIWDVGANIGDHTRKYLDWGCQVVAVEPNPLAFACLAHNCPEAIAINAAASDTKGEPLRFMRLDNVGASRIHPDGDILVDTVVLDEENLPVPGFVKIDVEGFEPFALRGMQCTLREHRPLVFCEINRGALAGNGFTPDDIIGWMKALGYKADLLYPRHAKHGDEQYDILFVP